MDVTTHLTGQRFGKWTVVRLAEKPEKYKSLGRWWLVRCDCGNEALHSTGNLRAGRSTSCKDCYSHGHAKKGHFSPTYWSWRAMRSRCLIVTDKNYPHYGGRGITVCNRWNDFNNFLSDMGERPPGLTLDRIDTNDNYEPANCRWVTHQEQMRNRRPRKLTQDQVKAIRRRVANGEVQRRIASEYGVSFQLISQIVLRKAHSYY